MVIPPDIFSDVDAQFIKDLDLASVMCWSQLQVKAAVMGYEMDKRIAHTILFSVFLYGSATDVIVDGILHGDDFDDFWNDPDTVAAVMRFQNYPDISYKIVKAISKINTIAVAGNFPNLKESKPRILEALDRRFPMLMARTYSKYREWLCEVCPDNLNWIRNIYKRRSSINDVFKKVHSLIEDSVSEIYRNISLRG